MVSSGHIPWKEIAWNGISFLAPARWAPVQIGTHYLLMEDASAPVLEIKWGRIRGPFSHSAYLRRIAGRQKKHPGKTLRECAVPIEWEKALGSYETTGFSWQGRTVGGMGLIAYCPFCRNATLIQFYHSGSGDTDQTPQQLLASFRDHRRDGQIQWSAFDICATVPADLKIMRHRFEAGQFELRFRSKAVTVILNRWGPASILLAGKDLTRFVESAVQLPASKPPTVISENQEIVEWMFSDAPGRWPGWLSRARIRPSLQRLRFWHLGAKNRILGVRVEAPGPLSASFFEHICAGFNSV